MFSSPTPRVDRAHAEKLAAPLKYQRLPRLWDADLYASQDYHDTIMVGPQRLQGCRRYLVPNAFEVAVGSR